MPTSMPGALLRTLLSWHQLWHVGVRVRETRPPFRQGTIIAVSGAGPRARITVAFSGGTPAVFFQSDLTVI